MKLNWSLKNGSLVISQFLRRLTGPLSFADQFRQNDGHSYGLNLNIPYLMVFH